MRPGERTGPPVAAIYRDFLLARSETFVRNEALALRRYTPLFAGRDRAADSLELPQGRVVLGTPPIPLLGTALRLVPGYSLRRLTRACRSRGVALIHSHFGTESLLASDLAGRLGVPLIVTYHGYDASLSDAALGAGPRAHRRYLRRRAELFERATTILAVSGFIAGEVVRQGAPEAKVRVHHLGVALPPPPDRAPGEPLVLFVGRLVEKKGLRDLLEAMTAVPDARLLIVGDGPLRPELEAEAARLRVAADFAGWLPPEEVARRFDEARVLCVPSRRAAGGDAEGLPTVILEAGARGLPTVGTRHSGIPEAIEDGAGGLLAAEGDVAGIARGLTAALGDDELWRRLSRGARETVERDFDVRRRAEALEAIYDEALSASGPPSRPAAPPPHAAGGR